MRINISITTLPPVRERSQGTVRWMRSIRADIDGVTRIILMKRGKDGVWGSALINLPPYDTPW